MQQFFGGETQDLEAAWKRLQDLEVLVGTLTSERDVGVLSYGQPGLAGAVPIGGVIPWYGVAAEVPAGWAIVDGTVSIPAGTPPDLRDKVIIGAGTTYALGATGGAATAGPLAHAGAAVSAHAGAAVSAHAGAAVSAHAGAAVGNHASHIHTTSGVTVQSGLGQDAGAHLDTGGPTSTLTHSVTQPDNHSVTQPNNHTVTQPNDHTVTQPNDHAAFSTLPPYAAFYLIMRIG